MIVNGSGLEGMTPEELMAYTDGEETPEVRDRIASSPALQAEAAAYDELQRQLQGQLYRCDCPPPHTVGEYALAMVSAEECTRIAAHIAQCPLCADELRVFRSFLATEPLPALSPLRSVRRLIAALVPPAPVSPASASLRGEQDAETRLYRAGDTTLTLDIGAARGEQANLTGLLWRDVGGDDQATGLHVSLLAEGGEAWTTMVDELGNFGFEGIPFGEYQLEVPLGEDIVFVIEGVHIAPGR